MRSGDVDDRKRCHIVIPNAEEVRYLGANGDTVDQRVVACVPLFGNASVSDRVAGLHHESNRVGPIRARLDRGEHSLHNLFVIRL